MRARSVILPLAASAGLVGLATAAAVGLHSLIGTSDNEDDVADPAASTAAAPADFCTIMGEYRASLSEMTEASEELGLLLFTHDEADEEAVLADMRASVEAIGVVSKESTLFLRSAAAATDQPRVAEGLRALADFQEDGMSSLEASIAEATSIEEVVSSMVARSVGVDETEMATLEAFSVDIETHVVSECGFSISSQGPSGSAAKADASTLGKEIATYFVDWEEGDPLPTVSVDQDLYVLPNGVTAPVSPGVELGDQAVNSLTDWCVSTRDIATGVVYSYSSDRGLSEGACIPSAG